jgi:hypothetical protein
MFTRERIGVVGRNMKNDISVRGGWRLPCSVADCLPKYKDVPSEFGGSGEMLPN